MGLAHNINEKLRTNDIQILQNVTFETMLLSTKTLEGLQNSGFYKPSPVQLQGIPMGKCGFDLLLEAKSGTGKTAVFAVIALEKIDLSLGLQVVILSPTREIAAQICDVIKQIGSAYTGLCVEVVMGGLPVLEDIEKFCDNKAHIVVGSPGRLKHLIHDQHMDVSAVRLLVLDEADKLMEKSFLSEIKYINSHLPKQKQVVLSSATYPESCKEFLNHFVHGAQHVCPEKNSVLLGVNQKVTYVKYNSNIVRQTKIRCEELIKILSNFPFKQCLIFCNYQVRVAELHRMLKKSDWPVDMLHGQQDQSDRLGALKTLQEYKCRILISTDLASRGIDASNIDLVINFEPPLEWQTYLHRIGRAGRFGSYGTAITIASEGIEQKKFVNMFKSLNSAMKLSHLWDDESDTNSNKEQKQSKTRQEKSAHNNSEINNTIKPLGSKSNSTNKDLSNSNLLKPDEKIEILTSVTNEPYELLIKTCNSQVNIESFEDLLISYDKFNVTYPKVDYECSFIHLPLASNKSNVIAPSNHSSKAQALEKQLNSEEYTNKTNSDFMPKVNGIDLKSTRKYSGSEHFPNEYFRKYGLPTEFSSSKNKNLNLTYETIKMETMKHKRKNNKTRNQNWFSQKELSGNDTFPENSKSFQEKALRSKNSKGNKTEGTSKKHNNIKDYYSSSDINNSYINWYKQLKLRTKQLELYLYVDELSSI